MISYHQRSHRLRIIKLAGGQQKKGVKIFENCLIKRDGVGGQGKIGGLLLRESHPLALREISEFYSQVKCTLQVFQ